MVHKGFAYVGHIFSKGLSVIDVRDPKKPKTVKYVAAPHNTWTLHLLVVDDKKLVLCRLQDGASTCCAALRHI